MFIVGDSMKTRMEKYYNDSSLGRSSRNQDLYNKVYEEDYYTELGTLDSGNEIDITKVKEMLKNREDYQRAKQYRELLGEKLKPIIKETTSLEKEEKINDINQIMQIAKQNRQQGEEEYRKLSNTRYDVLGKLDIDELEKQAQELLEKNRKEEAELKELINTISSQTLAKQTKEALALDLLEDLKETRTIETATITQASIIQEEISVAKDEQTEEMDKSFFTTGAMFNKNDFEDLEDAKESKKTDKILIGILVFLVIVIIIILVLFLIKNLL